MTTEMVHMRSHRSHRHAHAIHRKSAVELLEASKGTYVKSTTVLNHRQELKHPENLSVGNGEVLSLPITAGKHSPSDDSTSLSKDCVRSRSKSREARNPNKSGEVISHKPSEEAKTCDNLGEEVHHKHSGEATSCKSSGERNSSRSPPIFRTDNLQQTTGDSTSPVFAKKSSVISSISSSLSQTSKSPSVPKKPLVSIETSDKSASVLKSEVTQTENSPFQVKKLSVSSSTTSSVSQQSVQSHSKNEVDSSGFKTPLTPPKPGRKPAVPPKPGSSCKPTGPPKPGPKPALQDIAGKPVPPPRSSRKQHKGSSAPAEINPDSPKGAMSSSEKESASDMKNQASDSSDWKRFSSVSASACESSSKEHTDKPVHSRDMRHSMHSHNEGFLKPLSAALSTSVGVLVERHRSPLPKPRIDKQLNEIELPPRRQLHRSQSDLSSCRHSRTSSDFSDLSSRLSRTSTEVERFFNEMGIDRDVLEPMRKLSETRKKELLESLSSLDSLEAHSLSSRLSNDLERMPMESEQDLSARDGGTTSVVERNARIIKWLCNVKKARTVQTRPVRKKSEAS